VKAFTDAFQQLRCGVQVNFGTRDSAMSKISRQQWQLGEKIRPFAMPRQETIYGKCVTKMPHAAFSSECRGQENAE